MSELLSVAEAGVGRVAVVSSDLRGLDLAVVNRLRANRIRVIGVHPADDEAAERRLRQLSVTVVLAVDASPSPVAEPSVQTCRGTSSSVLCPVRRTQVGTIRAPPTAGWEPAAP